MNGTSYRRQKGAEGGNPAWDLGQAGAHARAGGGIAQQYKTSSLTGICDACGAAGVPLKVINTPPVAVGIAVCADGHGCGEVVA